MPLTQLLPIFINFLENGASGEKPKQKISIFLKIVSVNVKGIKKVPILQVGWSAPAPLTPAVFRVVVLHTEAGGKRLFGDSVSTYYLDT